MKLPNEGLLPVHVYLEGISWKETFQVRIKDIFFKNTKDKSLFGAKYCCLGKAFKY